MGHASASYIVHRHPRPPLAWGQGARRMMVVTLVVVCALGLVPSLALGLLSAIA